jgi:hypothetical protein
VSLTLLTLSLTLLTLSLTLFTLSLTLFTLRSFARPSRMPGIPRWSGAAKSSRV